MSKPTKQQKHDEARDALINAIAYRRALRVLYDARNSTSIEQEVEDLLRENQPLSGMTDAQLVIEWEAFNPEEDPESDYVPAKSNLAGLRRRGKKRAARQRAHPTGLISLHDNDPDHEASFDALV